MAEEESVSQQENVPDSVDYIEAIKEMKQNTVDKEAYNKVVEENRQLLKSLINGETRTEEAPKKEIDVRAIEKVLATENNRVKNIDYARMMLDLREADLSAGKPDPFISPSNRTPTEDDLEQAQRVADALASCLEYADGDAQLFTQELQRIMVDVPLPKRK